jgi:hypothetical protein
MTAWGNFFVALVGAAAALTGLIFVGVSISLSSILAIPHLSGRALESLVLLTNIVLISSLCLVPDQSFRTIGLEVLLISLFVWIIILLLDIRMLRTAVLEIKRHYRRNIIFSQLAMLPYLLAGAMILTSGPTGIYFLIPGIFISLIKALTDAWVLLVEIHR